MPNLAEDLIVWRMKIFTYLISSIVLGAVSYFIMLNFDPGDKTNIAFLPVLFFGLCSFLFFIALFFLIYSTINMIVRRDFTRPEMVRRGILFGLTAEALISLRILSLLENYLLVAVIIIIPIIVEWFFMEISTPREIEI